jgi:hypothetical protein
MRYHVAMGTKLTADYPLKRTELKDGQTGLQFEKPHKAMPLRKKFSGGVLVESSRPYGDDWQVVDSFQPTGHTDVKEKFGVWKDRGWIFRNGKIDEGEVTPMRDIFRPLEKVGYAGGGVAQVTLYANVDNSELGTYQGKPTLSTDSHVSRKTYQFHHDAGPFADLYYREDQRLDREALGRG